MSQLRRHGVVTPVRDTLIAHCTVYVYVLRINVGIGLIDRFDAYDVYVYRLQYSVAIYLWQQPALRSHSAHSSQSQAEVKSENSMRKRREPLCSEPPPHVPYCVFCTSHP